MAKLEVESLPRDRQILQAAAELFFERGFAGTGVDAIGERIGVTGPAIYSHFKSKDEILATLCLEGIDRVTEAIGVPGDDPREDLEHIIRCHVREVLRDRRLANVYVAEAKALAPTFRRLIRRRLDQLRERWISTLERCWPGCDYGLLMTVTSAAMGLTNSVILWRDEAFETPGLEDLLVNMTLASLSVLDS
ncbi:MAG: TetR/AcrR family transcriptional regulator [Thermoleophilaceae bacterium]